MRQKELRIALVCYGGISLAVYMHGATKELWKLTRASRAFHDPDGPPDGPPDAPPDAPPDSGPLPTDSEAVWFDLLRDIAARHDLRLRVLPDIIAGASAGGINGIFLAQAVHSGQSLEPLTRLWLERADIDVLLDPDARLISRFFKHWAVPVVRLLLDRPGNSVSASVAPQARAEVRAKLSRLVRSRWFEPPFGGIGFARLLAEALDVMAASPPGPPLLPPGHPLDLFVTATDFAGHAQSLPLHSPQRIAETEHRLPIGFAAPTPARGGGQLAALPELVFAGRATAAFPGAFPPLRLDEIDRLMAEREQTWPGREAFVGRVLPGRDAEAAALIDGSVLVNAPFAEAVAVIGSRPAQREVDRRLVYIDPRPRLAATGTASAGPERGASAAARPHGRLPGFLPVLFGALSSIPREQPIRDNLEELGRQSRETTRLGEIVTNLRGEVEGQVEQLFGHTLFLDSPTPARLERWREKAQEAAASRAGYAYQGYVQAKFSGVVGALAALVRSALPAEEEDVIYTVLAQHLATHGLGTIRSSREAMSPAATDFFLQHDLAHRIRRLRLVARRLAGEWHPLPDVTDAERQAARDAVYHALSLYFDREGTRRMGPGFPVLAARIFTEPGVVLEHIASHRQLAATDAVADAILANAMARMPRPLRRLVLLAYLGFPFFDVVTLPLLRGQGLAEFDPVKVDRISPEDCGAIRKGGALACLAGVEFFNFGAFFSRAYRENDYLWGRLNGAERMIDILLSTLDDGHGITEGERALWRRRLFLAILDEEEPRLTADPALVAGLRAEVLAGG
jgi:patatin-related protein